MKNVTKKSLNVDLCTFKLELRHFKNFVRKMDLRSLPSLRLVASDGVVLSSVQKFSRREKYSVEYLELNIMP